MLDNTLKHYDEMLNNTWSSITILLLTFCIHQICPASTSWSTTPIEDIETPFSCNLDRVSNPTVTIHDEIIGTFIFEQYSTELLLLTANLEKRHFAHALEQEGKCTMKDMIRVCGNKYLLENFDILIDGQKPELVLESSSVNKDFIILTYNIPIPKKNIESIKVTSDYMFKYNDHSILKVIFEIYGPSRTFNIKDKKRTIRAKF